MIDFVSEQMGAGSSAIAAAASQALAATHYNVPGRRSSSLKASFEAISQGIATSQLSIGQVLNGGGRGVYNFGSSEGVFFFICNLRLFFSNLRLSPRGWILLYYRDGHSRHLNMVLICI